MDINFFIKGLIIGFAMAVPIGPIGIICVRKTLTEGRMHGMVIGLGAATADLLYGSVAAFGLTIISDTLQSHRVWIRLVGGALLIFLGIRTFRVRPADPGIPLRQTGKLRSYFTTIFLTFTNPITIFAFIAVFSALGLGEGLGFFFCINSGIGCFSWFGFMVFDS